MTRLINKQQFIATFIQLVNHGKIKDDNLATNFLNNLSKGHIQHTNADLRFLAKAFLNAIFYNKAASNDTTNKFFCNHYTEIQLCIEQLRTYSNSQTILTVTRQIIPAEIIKNFAEKSLSYGACLEDNARRHFFYALTSMELNVTNPDDYENTSIRQFKLYANNALYFAALNIAFATQIMIFATAALFASAGVLLFLSAKLVPALISLTVAVALYSIIDYAKSVYNNLNEGYRENKDDLSHSVNQSHALSQYATELKEYRQNNLTEEFDDEYEEDGFNWSLSQEAITYNWNKATTYCFNFFNQQSPIPAIAEISPKEMLAKFM